MTSLGVTEFYDVISKNPLDLKIKKNYTNHYSGQYCVVEV